MHSSLINSDSKIPTHYSIWYLTVWFLYLIMLMGLIPVIRASCIWDHTDNEVLLSSEAVLVIAGLFFICNVISAGTVLAAMYLVLLLITIDWTYWMVYDIRFPEISPKFAAH